MSEAAVRLCRVGKMYKLHARPSDRVLDAFGLSRLLFWRGRRHQEFWALRDVDLEITPGERVGIIGPNGAGKSTLLKIICGNVSPTEGETSLPPRVQALMELGTGFHPEFTGRQNIRASLAYQGLSKREAARKEREITDFAELDEFIDQPVRTYSAGMYARLAFSTATAIEPEVLIIDEVLGAGDAYFNRKCLDRMKRLTEESGATVLFVSHDMTSVQRLCTRCVWLERGRVAMEGPPLDVIKAYERHGRIQEERRLRAKNLKMSVGGYRALEADGYADGVLVRFACPGARTEGLLLHEVRLLQNGEVIADVGLGQPQDVIASHAAHVIMDSSSRWTRPVASPRGEWGRGIECRGAGPEPQGLIAFALWVYDPSARYDVYVKYTPDAHATVTVEVHDGDAYAPVAELPPGPGDVPRETTAALPALRSRPGAAGASRDTHWPGTRDLVIEKALVTDADGCERALFTAGETLRFSLWYRTRREGRFPVIFCAVLYRLDGVRVSCHLSEERIIEAAVGEVRKVDLVFESLNLGNGGYVFATALYRSLDPALGDEAVVYDLHERDYEFQVTGREAIDGAVFHHPAEWRLQDASPSAR